MKQKGVSLQYACFNCRLSFKRPQFSSGTNRFMTSEQQLKQYEESKEFNSLREYKCPNCGGDTFYMGIDFKAPKKNDKKSWDSAKVFIESGKTFYRGNR